MKFYLVDQAGRAWGIEAPSLADAQMAAKVLAKGSLEGLLDEDYEVITRTQAYAKATVFEVQNLDRSDLAVEKAQVIDYWWDGKEEVIN